MTYEDYVYDTFMKNVPSYGSSKSLYVYYMDGSISAPYSSTTQSLYSFQSNGCYNRMEYNDFNTKRLKSQLKEAVKFVLKDSENNTENIVWERGELKYENKNQVISINGKYYSIDNLEEIIRYCEIIKHFIV